jgi:NTE family protein
MASRQGRQRRDRDDRPVGLVLAGGGARAAYEAGVLSVLLPKLARQGRRPTVFVGTSAAAINAALFASLAHLLAQQAASLALDRWRSVHAGMVIKPAWQALPPLGVRYAAALAGFPGQLTSLLDTSPLGRSLITLLDWEQLGRNLETGRSTPSWWSPPSARRAAPRSSSRAPVRPSAASPRPTPSGR